MRLMTVASVVGGYPLVFIAMRDATLTLACPCTTPPATRSGRGGAAAVAPKGSKRSLEVIVSLLLLAAVTVAAVFATDARSRQSEPPHARCAADRSPGGAAHAHRARRAQIRLLIAIRGAALGSLITLVLPSLVLLHSPGAASRSAAARVFAKALIAYGTVSSVLGTVACVMQG